MKKELMTLFLFIGICFVAYLLFKNLDLEKFREGMATSNNNTTSQQNGIAGNAASFAASIKQKSIEIQDKLLIDKYRSDYENMILNLDEYLDTVMLQVCSSLPLDRGSGSVLGPLIQISQLNQAKAALNNIMKFIDKSGTNSGSSNTSNSLW